MEYMGDKRFWDEKLLSRRLEAPVPCSLFYPKSVA